MVQGLQGAGPRAFSSGLVLAFLTMGGFESATTLGYPGVFSFPILAVATGPA